MRHGAAQHDEFGVHDVDHVGEDPSQQVAQLLEQREGSGVAGGAGLSGLLVVAGDNRPLTQLLDDGALGQIGLQAAAVAAATGPPIRHGRDVTHLAGEAA